MKTTAGSIAVVLGVAANAWAIFDNYSPFPPGTRPHPYALHECKCYGQGTSPTGDPVNDFAVSRHSYPRVSVQCDVEGGTVMLKDKDGKTLASSKIEYYGRLTLVYTADLNGDKIADFVTQTWSEGCGLAAEMTAATFFLSHGSEYVARALTCYDAEPKDFVDINKDGKPEFIYTVFVYGDGEKTKDGKEHNYYVYNLLRFEGTDIVSANDLDPRFPAWIYYRFKPSHENTDLLTVEQRMRLWRKNWGQGPPANAKSTQPHLEALEKEQARTVPKAPATQPGKPKAKSKGKS